MLMRNREISFWKKALFGLGASCFLLGCSGTKALPAPAPEVPLPQKYEYQITPVVFNYPENWQLSFEGESAPPKLSAKEVEEEREYHAAVGETIILWAPERITEDGDKDLSVRILATLYVKAPPPNPQEMAMIGEVYEYPKESKYLRYRTRITMDLGQIVPEMKQEKWLTDDYTLQIGSDMISIWVSYKDEETYKKVNSEVESMIQSFRLQEE